MIIKLDDVSSEDFAKLVAYVNSPKNQFYTPCPTNNVHPPIKHPFIKFRDVRGSKEDRYEPSLSFTMVVSEIHFIAGPDKQCPFDPFDYRTIPRRAIDGVWKILGMYPQAEEKKV